MRHRVVLPALLLIASLGVATGPARALPVGLDLVVVPPTPGLVEPGSSVFVEIVVSGLTAGGAPSLTAFELDLGFDDGVFDFVGVEFLPFPAGISLTNGTGQPCTLANLDAICDVLLDSSSSTGLVELAAASLVAPADVNLAQPASGAVARLEFLAHSGGETPLSFTQVALSGTISGTTQGTLSSSPSSIVLGVVPEPAGLLLLASGAAGLAIFRSRGVAHGSIADD